MFLPVHTRTPPTDRQSAFVSRRSSQTDWLKEKQGFWRQIYDVGSQRFRRRNSHERAVSEGPGKWATESLICWMPTHLICLSSCKSVFDSFSVDLCQGRLSELNWKLFIGNGTCAYAYALKHSTRCLFWATSSEVNYPNSIYLQSTSIVTYKNMYIINVSFVFSMT